MEVSKRRLSIIGKMIGIYREENRANTQNAFTQKRFCKDICSTNTLKNIENGELARSIDVYIELLAKFDLKLGEFPAIDAAILSLTDDLYEAIEYYRLDDILLTVEKTLRVLDKVKDYIYYSDLYTMFESVKWYYKDEIFIKDKTVERNKLLMYIYPIEYADIFRFLIYAKVKAHSISSKYLYSRLIDDISMLESSHKFIKINLIDYYYIMGQYKTMETLIDELISVFKFEKKLIRLFDVYNYSIVLLSNLEFRKCEEYIIESEKMLTKYKIPDIKKSDLYSNIAIAYQINEMYDKGLSYYNKMLQIDHGNLIDSYIFMADCQNHLKIEINIPLVSEDAYRQYPYNVKVMYKYFTLGNDIPDFAKENYILKEIVPTLTDEFYIKIFRYEIVKLVNKTGHYKSTHQFDLKVEGNQKQAS